MPSWTAITFTNDDQTGDYTVEVPVDLARVAHDLRLTVGPRTRDAGRWQALARRFSSDRRLILSAPDHGRHVWVGNSHAQRSWADGTPEYAIVRWHLASNGLTFGLDAPAAIRLTVRTYGPAPSPDAYGIDRLTVAPDIDGLVEQAIGGHARRVTHWTAIAEGLRTVWVAHTRTGDRVYFDPDVAGAHADAAWVELDGPHRAASAWDRDGRCVGVIMPIRHTGTVWQ